MTPSGRFGFFPSAVLPQDSDLTLLPVLTCLGRGNPKPTPQAQEILQNVYQAYQRLSGILLNHFLPYFT